MKVLVTGGTGFAGRHLIKCLTQAGHTVVATTNNKASLAPEVEVIELDLADSQAVHELNLSGIDAIYNLAGLAAVGASFNEARKYLDINAGIQINLFEECLRQAVKPQFLVVSSGNVYAPKSPLPLSEESQVLPVSPYALSKLAQEITGKYYGSRGFEVIISRSFNHMGPGQMAGFIVADFAKQIAKAEKDGGGKIACGNLDAQRDYTDVRDIATAYCLLIEKGAPGEIYNVCSGKPISGHEILSGLLAHSQVKLDITQDASLMRPTDNPIVFGSNHKINEATAWVPQIPLEQTLSETLNYWRNKV